MTAWIRNLGVATVMLLSTADAFAFPHYGIVQLSAGDGNTCALLADHHVACWGSDYVANSTTPQDVSLVNSAIQVVAGNRFACVINVDQSVWCWGANETGELGDGSKTNRPLLPSAIPTIKGYAIGANSTHACVSSGDFLKPYCWGSNVDYESSLDIDDKEVLVPTLPYLDALTPQVQGAIALGRNHTCVENFGRDFGTFNVWCWGDNTVGQCGHEPIPFATYCSPDTVLTHNDAGDDVAFATVGGLSAGGNTACVLSPETTPLKNSVACWGDNSRGQVGASVGSKATRATAVRFPDSTKLSNVLSLAVGGEFACAILEDHTVACWGDNAFGQLGNDTFTDDMWQWPLPVQLFGVKIGNIIQLAAGNTHICAMAEKSARQQILCWGNNDQGQLGTGPADADYHNIPQVVAVDAPIFTDDFERD